MAYFQHGTAAKIDTKLLQYLEIHEEPVSQKRLYNIRIILGNVTSEVQKVFEHFIMFTELRGLVVFKGLPDRKWARLSDSANIGEASHRNLGPWLVSLRVSSIKTFNRRC